MIFGQMSIVDRFSKTIVWFAIGTCVLAASGSGRISLLRTYKDASLVGISADGRLMLTRRTRKVTDCPDRRLLCYADVLEVYETGKGKRLGELASRGDGGATELGSGSENDASVAQFPPAVT